LSQIASKEQLRMSFIRWALVMVPLIIFCGFLSGAVAGSGETNRWYAMLAKPSINPPGWVFPIVWTILYAMQGLALAMILNARGARERTLAIILFAAQFVVSLSWSQIFFGWHKVGLAFLMIIAMLGLAVITTMVFGRIRPMAAWLMLPYLLWLSFASILNYKIDQLNPGAEALVPERPGTHITL
jgi:translocator protein